MEDVTLAIFDLDGTIANSRPGIFYSYRSTLRDYGHPDVSDEELQKGLSGSLNAGLKEILGLEDDEVPAAVNTYRDYYVEKGESMTVPFEGIEQVFDRLQEAGLNLAVATMKVEEFAKSALWEWGMLKRFQSVHGADYGGYLTKADLIRMCLEDGSVDPADAVMIGDSRGDYTAAKEAGVRFIGATYGFNMTPAFCRREGVPYAETPGRIADIILGSE